MTPPCTTWAKGKRVVIAEELASTMTLDCEMMKRLAGGEDVTVTGRPCKSATHFRYV